MVKHFRYEKNNITKKKNTNKKTNKINKKKITKKTKDKTTAHLIIKS